MTGPAFFGTVFATTPPDRAAAETGAALLRDQGLAAEVTPEGQILGDVSGALTVPCEGIGVWEGARGFWRGRSIQIWEPMDGGRWATFHGAPDGGEQVPWFRYEPISAITLDLTHRPTWLEARQRAIDRAGRGWVFVAMDEAGATPDHAVMGELVEQNVRALAIVLRQVFGATP